MNADQLQAKAEEIAALYSPDGEQGCAGEITALVTRAVREEREAERERIRGRLAVMNGSATLVHRTQVLLAIFDELLEVRETSEDD